MTRANIIADRIAQSRASGTEPYFIRNNAKVVDGILKPQGSPLSAKIRERRREIKEQAYSTFEKANLAHPLFSAPIIVSNAAIKEWLNQPFAEYAAKNEMLLELPDKFAKASYLGFTSDAKRRKDVVCSHIFETEVGKKKAWIIVHEMVWGEMKLHSISDNDKVKTK